VLQPGILDRLAGRVDAVDDEGIDLALDLVIDPLVGIEAVFVVRRLDLASDAALEFRRVEMGDRPRPALPGKDVGPGRLDIATQRSDEPETGYDDTAHDLISETTKGSAVGPSLPSPSAAGGTVRDGASGASALVLFDVLVGGADWVDLPGCVV